MKTYIVTLLIGLCILSVSAQENILNIRQTPIHSINGGGEFVISSPTHRFATFNTFCLEKTEFIDPNETYYYAMDGKNVDGGNTGGGQYGRDPISIGTAWLYKSFRDNTLPLYSHLVEEQNILQDTFWFLENEINTLSDYRYFNIVQASQPTVSIFTDANGAYGVNVWNLYTMFDRPAQSQLGMVTDIPVVVPEPNGYLLVLIGFLVLTLRHRNRI